MEGDLDHSVFFLICKHDMQWMDSTGIVSQFVFYTNPFFLLFLTDEMMWNDNIISRHVSIKIAWAKGP